jgi:hypothetical protein
LQHAPQRNFSFMALGLLCALTGSDHPAYRFAEVSIGLEVALLFAWARPERQGAPASQ